MAKPKCLLVLLTLQVGLIAVGCGEQPLPTTGNAQMDPKWTNGQFAVDLYQRLRMREGDLIVCPHSVSMTLAMLHAGAKAETRAQIERALAFAAPPAELRDSLSRLSAKLAEAGRQEGCQLYVANALWKQKAEPFRPEFVAVIEGDYGARVSELDFKGACDKARHVINDWTSRATRGKIDDLMGSGSVSELTRLVLTNAVFLKARWVSPFDASVTRDAPFWTSRTQSVSVPMMSQLGKFGYAESDSFQVLELPYSGNALSAVVLLPRDKEGLPTLEEHLTWDLLSQWISQVSRQQVFVVLPKFTIASQFDLQDALRAMGVEDVFSPAHADLSGVSAERELYVSASVHKALVRVDEEGTEAAAATAMVGSLGEGSKGPPIFLADHPFIFVVRYVPTGDIMFIGRLVVPLGDLPNGVMPRRPGSPDG